MMKFWVGFSAFLILVAGGLVECQQEASKSRSPLVIDPSKPYVYLAVDHVGFRKPFRDGEVHFGIWFRLKNNCHIPIVVVASAMEPQKTEHALWVSDEVVPNALPVGAESVGSMIGYRHQDKDFTDIFLEPNEHEAQIEGAEALAKGINDRRQTIRPHGYIDLNAPASAILKVIPPGEEVLFSVPANHVSESWHLEVPFRFAIEPHISLRQPYSYVGLFWSDLPAADRIRIVQTVGAAGCPGLSRVLCPTQ